MHKPASLLFLIILLLGTRLPAHAQDLREVHTRDMKKLMLNRDGAYVINFMATWCEPCREELPTLLALAKQYADSNVKVIIVSLDYPNAYPDKIRAFMGQFNIQVPVLWWSVNNPNEIAATVFPGWRGLIPFTIFLNRQKKYRHVVEAEIPAEDWPEEFHKAL